MRTTANINQDMLQNISHKPPMQTLWTRELFCLTPHAAGRRIPRQQLSTKLLTEIPNDCLNSILGIAHVDTDVRHVLCLLCAVGLIHLNYCVEVSRHFTCFIWLPLLRSTKSHCINWCNPNYTWECMTIDL